MALATGEARSRQTIQRAVAGCADARLRVALASVADTPAEAEIEALLEDESAQGDAVVGVPIQIVPDPRVGVRIQADLDFVGLVNGLIVRPISPNAVSPIAPAFVTSVDIYPGAGAARPRFAEVSLLGQVSM